MTKVTFNTKGHWIEILFDGKKPLTYEGVMTIKNGDGFYEILQKQYNDTIAPLFRLPIVDTIIEYQHDVKK